MITLADLHGTAREYLRAAKLLRTRRSYDAAVYLCGYAVEIALKARICRTLKWTAGFPETPAEFQDKGSLECISKRQLAAILPLFPIGRPAQKVAEIGF